MTLTPDNNDSGDGAPGADPAGAVVDTDLPRQPRVVLRALVGVALVIGMAAGYVAMGRQKAVRQAEAIDVVVQAGGRVYLDYQWQAGEPVPDAQPPQAAWIRRLIGNTLLDRAVAVDLRGVEQPDDMARSLLLLPYVCHIRADDTTLSDTSLSLWRGKLGLTGLDLQGTRVTDTGVESLSRLTQLTTLSLARTAVSDESISSLARLKRLKLLDLSGTQVTSDAVGRLRGLLPKCRVRMTDDE